MTEFQRRKLALMFYRVDTSKDGYVERSDWEHQGQRIAELQGMKSGTAEYGRVISAYGALWDTYFRLADADGDGKVSLDEYLAGVEQFIALQGYSEDGLAKNRAMFDAVDLDGDGVISIKEYVIVLKAQGCSDEDSRLAFSKLDLDRDGKISREEYARAIYDYHVSDDPNAPGNWFYGSF